MVEYLKPTPAPVQVTPELLDQLTGWRRPAIVPAGLAPYMHLPAADKKTLVRARMAAVIERAMSANDCVTDRDLAEFDADEIREHLSAAKRIARVAGMAI